MREYKRPRSKFWLKIRDDDNVTISANRMVKRLVNKVSPDLKEYSFKGWKESEQYEDVFSLWIPADRKDRAFRSALEKLEEWAEQANQHIWLGTNKHTRDEFYGDEVDYCLAADWNKDFDTGERTDVGEAEYQMKYNYYQGQRPVDPEDAKEYAGTLASAILDCADCLPFDLEDFIVTAIPAAKAGRKKLAWRLAEYTAGQLGAEFMEAKLTKDKPQMKNTSVEDKIDIWREIYDDKDMVELSCNVKGEHVLIIDDLYQSGASIWCFAEYLKGIRGAKKVMAITAVKAQKDGDNQ